jgi:hypothetical protein
MQTTNAANAVTTLGNCTWYYINGLGAYSKIELASATVEIKDDPARYRGAKKIVIRYTKKGCRKIEAIGYSDYKGIVFVDGHNTFDPASAFDASGTSKECFDVAYENDFDRTLAQSGAKIVADYRGFNLKK